MRLVGQLRIAGALFLCVSGVAQTIDSCRTLEHRGRRAEAKSCFEKLASSSNPAVRAEGFWGIGQFEAASKQFAAAVARQPKNPALRVRWGRMFLERANKKDAQDLFQEALELDGKYAPAHLGLALIASEGFEAKATEFAKRALEFDPKLVEAQELLAQLAVEDNNLPRAKEEAEKALKISEEALGAMAVLASIDLLQDRPETPWFGRIAKINPAYGEGYALAGHFLVLNRRYEEGIASYRKSLELNPDLDEAREQMGINLMRLGFETEAQEQLQKVYDRGYQTAATVNSLRLIDSYRRFVTFKTKRSIVRLHSKEAELLKPYIEGEVLRAVETFDKKYKFKLAEPVQVEVYPDHDDFAVRTLGMPGLGALGVTFGHVLAMDSPSGRPPGTFHWASTLWHELSHVYVLTATKHRVPRWFTEGMAVHEETAASPDWGDRLDPQAIRAIQGKKLLPIAELDRGFIHPSYPAQVVVSYFQAGQICDYITEKWGYDTLLAMMHSFAKSKTTSEVVKEHLGLEPEKFDEQFLAWLDKQTGETVKNFEEWRKRMKGLSAAAKAGRHDEVIKEGPAVAALYREAVEGESAYELIANAYLAKGDKQEARKQLAQYSSIGGRNPAILKKLAALQEEAGQKAEATRTLERILYVYPQDEELHKRLGDLYMSAGSTEKAIREYAAVISSAPIDQAASRFHLAQALRQANRDNEAKEQLLLALEAAPGYKPAQKLLLELSR